MEPAEFWWLHVSGPARMLNEAVEASWRHRVLLIEEPPCFPDFRNLFIDRLLQEDSTLNVYDDAVPGWEDPGEWLLRASGREMDYHPLDGSPAEVLAKRNWLAGRVYVVNDVHEHTTWVNFAVEYARHGTPDNGLMVLVFRGENPLQGVRRGVAVFRLADYLTAYDMQWFAAYCASRTASGLVRDYYAQLLARIAGPDPELCAKLAEACAQGNPLDALEAWADEHSELQRLADDPKRLESIVWEAQLQIVFPLLERLRRRFIDAYREGLQQLLPKRDDYGNLLRKPEDMELRHLMHDYFNNKELLAQVGGPHGMFRSAEDLRVFGLIYKARNRIAHMKTLNHADVLELLELDAYEPTRGRD